MRHYLNMLLFLFWLMQPHVVFAKGDPSGKDKAIICTGCHGTDGNNQNPTYPILAGQIKPYLLKQLKDFKSGTRIDDHMTSMVDAVQESDFEDIVAYFSSNKRTPITRSNKDNKKIKNNKNQGEIIFSQGIKDKSVPACASCHGALGQGVKPSYPSLASQHEEYLIKILKDFREGKRSNDKDKVMRNIATKLTSKEIESVAHYLSTLH